MSSPGFGSRVFLTGALSFVVTGMLAQLYGLAVPVYVQRFGLTDGGNVLLSLHGLGAFVAVVAGLFWAPLLTLRRGLLAMAAGIGLVALQISWPLILLGGILGGTGFGMAAVVVNRQFLSEFAARGPGVLSIVNAVYGLGTIVSPILLIGAGGVPALVFAGMAVLALLAVPFVVPEQVGPHVPSGMPNLARWPLLILIFNSLSAVIEVGLVGLGPTTLLDAGLDSFAVARLASGFSLCFLLGRVSLYWLTRWIGTDLLFLIALLGTAASLGVAHAGLTSIGFVLSGLFAAMFFPIFYVWAIGVLGDARFGSAILCSGLAAVTASPVMLGFLLTFTGVDALFGLLGGLACILALGFVPTLLWARRRMQAGPVLAL